MFYCSIHGCGNYSVLQWNCDLVDPVIIQIYSVITCHSKFLRNVQYAAVFAVQLGKNDFNPVLFVRVDVVVIQPFYDLEVLHLSESSPDLSFRTCTVWLFFHRLIIMIVILRRYCIGWGLRRGRCTLVQKVSWSHMILLKRSVFSYDLSLQKWCNSSHMIRKTVLRSESTVAKPQRRPWDL
jgi:hypothetical protein